MTVDVTFPCLNDTPALPWVLGKIPVDFRPIVIDNGSTDESGEITRSPGLLAATTDLVCSCDRDDSLGPPAGPRGAVLPHGRGNLPLS